MTRSVSMIVLSLLAGCYQSPIDARDSELYGLGVDEDASARATEGSPEALGMIAFLNDASTTFELLDDKVGLDRRAARSLIAHRDGADGILGKYGDDLFDSVEEIDDQYYVGKSALAAIESWALTHDWVATSPDDLLGTWDGVSFTVAEAEATVDFANAASYDLLDDDLELDSRAANSIVSAAEITSVEQLAGLYYVGKKALTVLRDAATVAPVCDQPGWDQIYVYNEGDGAWRDQVPAEVADLVDQLLTEDAWCGQAEGQPTFVKVAVDRYDCEDKAWFIELRQDFLGGGAPWYIEFEVAEDYSWFVSACEV